MKQPVPTRVVNDIKADKIVTRIYQGAKVIGVFTHNRVSHNGFRRKRVKLDEVLPDFMGSVDDFYITRISNEIEYFANGEHSDQNNDE